MLSHEMSGEQYVRTYLQLLWRRKWSIFAATAMTALVAFGLAATKTPMYQATSEVLLQPRTSESLFDPAGGGSYYDPYRDSATQILVITGAQVQALVAEKIGQSPPVTATAVEGTSVVRVTSVSDDPALAQRVANAYAVSYIEYRQKSDVEDLAGASKTIQEKITDLQRQIDGYDAQIASAPPAQRDAMQRAISSERDGLIAQLVGLKQTFDRIQLNTSLNRGGAQVVAKAPLPSLPFEPRPERNAATGAVVGLLLGVIMAFLRDLLDDRVNSKEDVERASSGVPVIGVVPITPGWKQRERTMLVSQSDPSSAASEAYRTLRTSVQFMSMNSPLRVLQITSPQAEEGKTTTVANLAMALARANQRVVVVCLDLRRPRLHEFFGMTNAVGFTSVLVGDVPLSSALQSVPGESNLNVLASGPEPPNPSELLSSMRTIEILTALQGLADVVLIDSPPVIPVADAAIISTRVDATLLVVSAASTTRKQVSRAIEILRQVEAPIIGVVLNRAKSDAEYGGYGYGYGYGYGAGRAKKVRAERAGDGATVDQRA